MIEDFAWYISLVMPGIFAPKTLWPLIIPAFFLFISFVPLQVLQNSKPFDLHDRIKMASLPVLWVLCGLCGAMFSGAGRHVAVVSFLPIVFLASFILYGGYLIFKNRENRGLTISWFALNVYFMLSMAFVTSMAITGNWL